jgi:hypothetical protein
MTFLQRHAWRGVLGLLGCLIVTGLGCNSGGGEPPRQVAQVERDADGGTFRNLGKRSAFDYGNVESAEPVAPR